MKLTRRPEWLILGILLIAANLRAPITGLPTLISAIQIDLGLSSTVAGLLTTTPLLVFAIISLLSPRIATRFGLESSLFYALWLMLIGVVIRSLPSIEALFLGNNIVAIGISMANVLLPSLIKRDFPYRVAFITGLYALTMGFMAAFVSAFAVPIANLQGSNWRYSLLMIGVMVFVALVVWWPQWLQARAKTRETTEKTSTMQRVSLWRKSLAWQVSLFFGLNSLLYYIVISWLPAILEEAGFSAVYAGRAHGMTQLATAFSGLIIIPLVARFKDQRPVVLIMIIPVFIGLLGLLFYPGQAMVWSAFLGLGCGGVFVLGLSFIGMRVSTSKMAASLSGMAQFVGYTLAATGPSITGGLHDSSGSWNSTLLLCMLIATVILLLGMFAGRDVRIENPPSTASIQ